MTVKEIARSAALLLQADEIEEALSSEDGGAEDADVKSMVKCVNVAAAELCSNGFSRLETSECEATGGVIPLVGLEPAPARIVEVKRGGAAVPFKCDSRGISVKRDGAYTVVYSAAFEDRELDDELGLCAPMDGNIVSYLAARNYCLMTGRTDDAAVWDQMYEREAENARLSRRAAFKPRAWY